MKKLSNFLKNYQDMFFPVFDVLLNGFNFFMHIYISWFISLNDYGVLNAMLSFLAILFVMGISMQLFTTKEAGKAKDDNNVLNDIFSMLFTTLIIINILMVLFSQTLINILRTDLLSIILIIAIFNVNLILSFFRGVLQSKQKFLRLNESFYVEVISKLVFIIAVLPFVAGKHIPLLAILIGMLLSLIHDYYILRNEVSILLKISLKWTRITRSFLLLVGSNFFFYYLTSSSLLFANFYIGEEAGLFAVSLKFSQLIMAVGFSVITVVIAYTSDLVTKPQELSRYVKTWLFRFILCGIVFLLGFQFIVRHLIEIFFGPVYVDVKDFMVFQAFGYVMLTIANLIISVLNVKNQKAHILYMGIISGLFTLGLTLFHDSIDTIIRMEVLSFSLLLIIVFTLYLKGDADFWKFKGRVKPL